MRISVSLRALALLPCLVDAATVSPSNKRGLVYVGDPAHPNDSSIWTRPGSDLTWYYNYQSTPSSNVSSTLQFVPMLWGAPASTIDNSFLITVQNLISSGMNISHVLSFNEPDGTYATGGSVILPAVAADHWIRVIEPLRQLGVKVGAPATTGSPAGLTWLQNFFAACKGQCTADFMALHFYGNFDGLASWIGQVRSVYNLTIWVTEYAYQDQSLSTTQDFFNTSAAYFDRLDYVTRYSYFGAARSTKSNIGPNAAMLDGNGRLTDIGSWYLGGSATGVIPSVGTQLVGSSVAALLALGACLLAF